MSTKTATRKNTSTISDTLKAAIAADPRKISHIAAAAGIAPIQVGRFVSGERDLRLASADRLAEALGLTLVKAG